MTIKLKCNFLFQSFRLAYGTFLNLETRLKKKKSFKLIIQFLLIFFPFDKRIVHF